MDPVIACFKGDFERFFAFLEKQIDVCPDDLWLKKVGGYPFWQQIFHTLACVELFALTPGAALRQTMHSRAVAMLAEEPKISMTKEEIRAFARDMRPVADAFFASMSVAALPLRNDGMSAALGKELTNQHALMGLVRHICYHLGSCDAALRDHGVPGVY